MSPLSNKHGWERKGDGGAVVVANMPIALENECRPASDMPDAFHSLLHHPQNSDISST